MERHSARLRGHEIGKLLAPGLPDLVPAQAGTVPFHSHGVQPVGAAGGGPAAQEAEALLFAAFAPGGSGAAEARGPVAAIGGRAGTPAAPQDPPTATGERRRADFVELS